MVKKSLKKNNKKKISYDKYFNEMLDYFNLILKNNIKGKVFVNYSAYKLDKNGVPINNIYDSPVNGRVRFYRKYDDNEYYSNYITNPTWLDICKIANESIIKLKDKDHIFLEDIIKTKNNLFSSDYEIYMGS